MKEVNRRNDYSTKISRSETNAIAALLQTTRKHEMIALNGHRFSTKQLGGL